MLYVNPSSKFKIYNRGKCIWGIWQPHMVRIAWRLIFAISETVQAIGASNINIFLLKNHEHDACYLNKYYLIEMLKCTWDVISNT